MTDMKACKDRLFKRNLAPKCNYPGCTTIDRWESDIYSFHVHFPHEEQACTPDPLMDKKLMREFIDAVHVFKEIWDGPVDDNQPRTVNEALRLKRAKLPTKGGL